MAESNGTSPKVDPESLALRANPRKVVRFKRNLLIGAAAIGAVAIFGTTWFALAQHQSTASSAITGDIYNTDRKPTPDGLATLPQSYDKLGAPLPGDLGKGVVDRERSLGVSSDGSEFPSQSRRRCGARRAYACRAAAAPGD